LKYIFAFSLLLLILCSTTLVIAQSTNATLSGVVVDPAGKVITDADIEILNEATGVQYSGKTNDAGIYTVSILPPGQYRVQVSKIGFKTLIKPGIVLNVQSAVALNFTLPVGAASESVTVAAGSSFINTENASVSTVIDSKFVENIPLNGRSFQDLISMTPGVVTQSPQASSSIGYNGDFSVNGERTESNYYTVDGIAANIGASSGYGGPGPGSSGSLSATTALGTTQSMISVDALQEFRVESSSYSAEYGRGPGGQFAMATRSGANEFHGSAFDYLRNNCFDANNWFNDYYSEAEPALRQNDFGGTVGGPVVIPKLYSGKDQFFFFGSYEGLRLTQPQAASVLFVPDASLRQSAPAALQPILNAFPVQNGTDFASTGLAEFIQAYSIPSSINSSSLRLDYHASPKLALFFRAGYAPTSTENKAESNMVNLTTTNIDTLTYTAGITSQFNSHFTNEVRAGYAISRAATNSALTDFGGAQPIDLAEAFGLGAYSTPYPVFEIYIPGIGETILLTEHAFSKVHQWNVVDTVGYAFGKHALRFGMDYRVVTSPFQVATPEVIDEFTSGASLLNNTADYMIVQKFNGAEPQFREFSAFIEDEWRVARSVGLSLGLRWDVNPAPTGANGQDAYTVDGNINQPATLTLAPAGTPLWQTGWYNLAPRLGLAWTANHPQNWQTVVRTGAGVFYDTADQLGAYGFECIGFRAEKVYTDQPVPTTSTQLSFPISAAAPYTSTLVFAFPQHLELPYSYEWNVALEQALGRNQALSLSYIGSNGRRLLQEQILSLYGINPNFGTVYYVPNGVTSNYQALQVKFQRAVSHGLQALVSYTWSHAIDFGSNDAALPLTRGNSDFDVRHSLQAGLSWDVPHVSGNQIAKVLFDRWGVDGRLIARTSFPITLAGNELINTDGSIYYTNVDLVRDEPIYLHGAQYPGGRALNPAAFAFPSGSNPGTAPRNFVRGFGEEQVNLALRRTFPLHDRLALQFRAEAFNILNHPNFGYVDSYLTDLQFGLATSTLNQSLGTVASQYQQGGPRSMQFALRLQF